MFKLETRNEQSLFFVYFSPFISVIMSIFAGAVMFMVLGENPVEAMKIIFINPLKSLFGLSELMVKATPLIIIAIGLSLGFKAGVWNIGAEGQYTIGALCSGSLALALYPISGFWVLPLVLIAGIIGGSIWAAIPALLKTKFNTHEILVSLMLTYVAILLLSVMVHGPLRDPDGFNFPESRLFHYSALLPILIEGTRAHIGTIFALIIVFGAYVIMGKHVIGYQIRISGESSKALSFSGYSKKTIIWICFLTSGALAGIAGAIDITGPVGQLVPSIPVGYGFTGIIVAFLGRLNPVGILFSGILLALTYIGGEAAQIKMSLPSAITGVFQGMLLFFLLATDVLVNYKIKLKRFFK